MSRRIDIELTSARDDGTWTWRAAGAREPKGVLDGSLLPSGAGTGDVVRADVDTSLDGTTVLAVLPPKGPRAEPERIELVGAADPDQWVTTVLAPGRPRREGGDRRDRRDRRDGRPPRQGRDDRPPRDGDRQGQRRGQGQGQGQGRGEGGGGRRPPRTGDNRDAKRGERPRSSESRPRPPRPPVDTRPKPKRLRAKNVHRKAVLAELPPEQQPVAEQVLKGGIPAVRAAVAKQNEQARAEGKPEVKADQLVDLAEKLLPRLRAAEWRDRAEAALADLDELDLRDLRSVIVAADGAARDDEARALATSLREGLARRVDEEQGAWRREIASTLSDGRVVRALRLSSRPPKAGDPLPPDLATRLVEAANAALTSDTASDRWATVLDALSFSPVHLRVEPVSVPAEPDEALLTAVRAAAARVPQIATKFGIDPATAPPPRRSGGPPANRRRPARKPPAAGAAPSKPAPAEAKPPADDAPTPATDAPETPAPVAEAPAPDAPETAAPATEVPAEEPIAPVPEPGTPEAEPAPVEPAPDEPTPDEYPQPASE
ncbi:MAG: hypothetical protein JO291_00525 [Acidimicrobiia bacterium]|nr:hypothetical protein [Acidimicrobiia bacterium]